MTGEALICSADRTGDHSSLLRYVAFRLTITHGSQTIAHLYSQEVEAVARGDRFSAEGWADLATTAEQFLVQGRPESTLGCRQRASSRNGCRRFQT
jgi:hypothetical protein